MRLPMRPIPRSRSVWSCVGSPLAGSMPAGRKVIRRPGHRRRRARMAKGSLFDAARGPRPRVLPWRSPGRIGPGPGVPAIGAATTTIPAHCSGSPSPPSRRASPSAPCHSTSACSRRSATSPASCPTSAPPTRASAATRRRSSVTSGRSCLLPSDTTIRQNLALAFYKTGDLGKSADEAARIVAAQPGNGAAPLLLAECRLRLGEHDEVVRLLQREDGRPPEGARPRTFSELPCWPRAASPRPRPFSTAFSRRTPPRPTSSSPRCTSATAIAARRGPRSGRRSR